MVELSLSEVCCQVNDGGGGGDEKIHSLNFICHPIFTSTLVHPDIIL